MRYLDLSTSCFAFSGNILKVHHLHSICKVWRYGAVKICGKLVQSHPLLWKFISFTLELATPSKSIPCRTMKAVGHKILEVLSGTIVKTNTCLNSHFHVSFIQSLNACNCDLWINTLLTVLCPCSLIKNVLHCPSSQSFSHSSCLFFVEAICSQSYRVSSPEGTCLLEFQATDLVGAWFTVQGKPTLIELSATKWTSRLWRCGMGKTSLIECALAQVSLMSTLFNIWRAFQDSRSAGIWSDVQKLM